MRTSTSEETRHASTSSNSVNPSLLHLDKGLTKMFVDELSLLFTGSPAPAASRESRPVQVIDETDEPEASQSTPFASPEPSGTNTPIFAELNASTPESLTREHPLPTKSGAIHPILAGSPAPKEGAHPLFGIEQLGVDRRLIVNRKRQLKMYRVWMQGKFRKL